MNLGPCWCCHGSSGLKLVIIYQLASSLKIAAPPSSQQRRTISSPTISYQVFSHLSSSVTWSTSPNTSEAWPLRSLYRFASSLLRCSMYWCIEIPWSAWTVRSSLKSSSVSWSWRQSHRHPNYYSRHQGDGHRFLQSWSLSLHLRLTWSVVPIVGFHAQ